MRETTCRGAPQPSLRSAALNKNSFCLRGLDEVAQPLRFCKGYLSTKGRQTVGLASLGRPFHRLADQSIRQQPLQDSVERAGAQPDTSHGALLDFLQNRVAVFLAVGERQHDVERCGGERQTARRIPRRCRHVARRYVAKRRMSSSIFSTVRGQALPADLSCLCLLKKRSLTRDMAG